VTVRRALEGSADARAGMSLTCRTAASAWSPDDIPAALRAVPPARQRPHATQLGHRSRAGDHQGQIELHGGRLDITSAAGAGTRATLYFPPERVLPEHALARSPRRDPLRHD